MEWKLCAVQLPGQGQRSGGLAQGTEDHSPAAVAASQPWPWDQPGWSPELGQWPAGATGAILAQWLEQAAMEAGWKSCALTTL